MAFDLAPEVEAEGRKWRFLGIQSKNREEWNLTNWANMHQCITTVALYDTLGQEAMKFVCNQTEMTTIFSSSQFVGSIAKLKLEDSKDSETKMHRIHTIVSFDDEVDKES